MKKLLSILKLKTKVPASDIAISQGRIINTDLQNFIIIYDNLVSSIDEGQYSKEGLKAGIFDKVGNMDTFPKLPELIGVPEKITLNSDTLLKMYPFASDDELRPTMCGVYFDKDQMAATNAHKLAWLSYPKNQSVKAPFIMRREAIKILPKNTEIGIFLYEGHVMIEFMFAGCMVEVISPKVDYKFIDYKAVIPSTDDAVCSVLVSKADFQWDKLAYAANKASTPTFSIEGSSVKIRVEDIDRNTEFEQEFQTKVVWNHPNNGKHISGMNIKLLKECMEFYSDPLKIYFQPDKRPNNIGDNIILAQCRIES